MILFRFMHRSELMKYHHGDTIKSLNFNRVHFLEENVRCHYNGSEKLLTPYDCYNEFIGGIICGDILAKFEIDDDLVSPKVAAYLGNRKIVEQTVKEYNKNNAKLLSFEILEASKWFASKSDAEQVAQFLFDYSFCHGGVQYRNALQDIAQYIWAHNIGHRWHMPKGECQRLMTNINVVV